MAQKTIEVEGMTCGHCKSAVEGALSELEGVKSADVNLDANNVNVEYDESKVTESSMAEAIEDQGYDVKQ
ncbi:copper chaperone CopZ [Salinicoccus sp. RF5]|uniref:copper chaperone CopZ n=1 Tax=Salinicoccus sp. RF5 TaxID=2748874 RepID=UPI001E4C7391|nr:copper chaperone CopZ [Salinicoccus sp. RF5]MCC4723065.1 copper chaperone CopZ [Salinicoccus sp. RF5]